MIRVLTLLDNWQFSRCNQSFCLVGLPVKVRNSQEMLTPIRLDRSKQSCAPSNASSFSRKDTALHIHTRVLGQLPHLPLMHESDFKPGPGLASRSCTSTKNGPSRRTDPPPGYHRRAAARDVILTDSLSARRFSHPVSVIRKGLLIVRRARVAWMRSGCERGVLTTGRRLYQPVLSVTTAFPGSVGTPAVNCHTRP